MKLLKIAIGTNDKTGATFTIREMEVTETTKSYVGEGRRIDKDKVLRVDTNMYNNSGALYFYTYCFESEKEKAAKLLIEACNDRYKEITEKFLHLTTSMELLNKTELVTYFKNSRIPA